MRRLLLITAVLAFRNIEAQLRFKGAGIFGAVNSTAHYYRNLLYQNNPADTAFAALYPQSHHSKERISWGAGAFLELGGSRIRWQTELEYMNKGALEMEVVNPRTGDRSGEYEANRLTYIQWNNYIKFYFPIGFAHWYLLPGIRAEYLFRSSPAVFTIVSDNFPRFWFSGNLGLGYEMPLARRISVFIEGHWNPDVLWHDHDNVEVRSRSIEARVGLVLRPRKKSIDDCNAPIYKGPAY